MLPAACAADGPRFLADVRPLLAVEEAERFDDAAATTAFSNVFTRFIQRFPGQPWARTPAMIEHNALGDAIG